MTDPTFDESGHAWRNEGMREHELDGELTLYDPETQRALVLNTTATEVWRLSDGTRAELDIVTALSTTYDATPDQIGEEVRSLLDQLHGLGLLEQRDPPLRRG